jgi:hypothetical protein
VLLAFFVATGLLAIGLQALFWAYERQLLGAKLNPGQRALLTGPVGAGRVTQALAIATASLAASILASRLQRRWDVLLTSKKEQYDDYFLRTWQDVMGAR